MTTFFIALTGLLGLYMAWTVGANDVANSMADAVGSKSVSIRKAIILAAICEFCGAVLVGSHVTQTVRKGIVDPTALASMPNVTAQEGAALLALGMMAALLAAAIWLHIATRFGMPVSTTHSIVGAVAGVGVVAAGWSAVHWGKLGQIIASWFVSPVCGGLLAFVLFKYISRFILGRERPAKAAVRMVPPLVFLLVGVVALAIRYKGLKHVMEGKEDASWLSGNPGALVIAIVLGIAGAIVSRKLLSRKLRAHFRIPLADQLDLVERTFAPLVILTSCTVAFAHGANDVANAIGPLAAVAEIFNTGKVEPTVAVPLWVLSLGGFGIVLGLATYGYRVMLTVGSRITVITPSRGVAADMAALTTVLTCSLMGLPVSTTHTLVGAILGVALARGHGSVNKRVTRNIFGSWLITVPAAALLAILLFLLGKMFLMDQIVRAIPLATVGG